MISVEDINKSIVVYKSLWEKMIAKRTNKDFFNGLRPTAVAWKTTDLNEFDTIFGYLRNVSEQVHIKWLNDRWVATMHLNATKLEWDIEVIKLMQRRPGSKDAVGLDHLDFYSPEVSTAKNILNNESELNWTQESNNAFCNWISLWFAGTEAKLRTETVVDVCILELEEVKKKLLVDAAKHKLYT